jgi:type I restriction enzyme R subunit
MDSATVSCIKSIPIAAYPKPVWLMATGQLA